jgi:hypothetical protein
MMMCVPVYCLMRLEGRTAEPGCIVCHSDAEMCVNGDHFGPCGLPDCQGGCTYVEPCDCPCHHIDKRLTFRHWEKYRPKYTRVGDNRFAQLYKKTAYFRKATM